MVTLVVRRCSPFHKEFRNCRDEGKRYGNLIESFQKTQISKIQTIQPKIPKTPGRKSQSWNGTSKFFTIFIFLEWLSSFPEIPENTVLFATKNVRKIQTRIIA